MKHPGGVEIVEEYLREDGTVKEYARRKPADLVHIMDNAPGCLHKWKTHERRRCYDAYDFCVERALEDRSWGTRRSTTLFKLGSGAHWPTSLSS